MKHEGGTDPSASFANQIAIQHVLLTLMQALTWRCWEHPAGPRLLPAAQAINWLQAEPLPLLRPIM